ncbi:MAG: hypothetical protein QOC66_2093 [Pseudonocardiales bacterium]|nr:hypothetical protein [Pseudonocardiales bacterium]
MTPVGQVRAGRLRSDWPVAGVPRQLLSYLLAVDAVVVGWSALELVRVSSDERGWWVLALLGALAVGFEEGAARAAGLQLRLRPDLKHSMVSVWTVAGAVALPPGQAVLLVGSVLGYVWLRQYRPAAQPAYQWWFIGSTQLLGCLAAGLVVRTWAHNWAGLPWGLAGSLSVLIAIVVQTVVNRTAPAIAEVDGGARRRSLLGSRDQNLTELATLCLGGLVALAAVEDPWLCILVLAPMITLQRGALVRDLETAASTDAKTGLLNADAWEQLARRELARADRDGKLVAILIIDIDRFKLINDRHGHLAGDVVLRGVGQRLAAEVREYDSVGRFGGEEFVAVLPAATERDALGIAERLRARVSELRVSALIGRPADEPGDPALSISIGVACFPRDGSEVAALLGAADGALYRAKAQGRNRVELAERGGPVGDIRAG